MKIKKFTSNPIGWGAFMLKAWVFFLILLMYGTSFTVQTANGRTSNVSPYCRANVSCGFSFYNYHWIDRVEFNSRSNGTYGCSYGGGPTYFNNITDFEANIGQTHNMTVETDGRYSFYSDGYIGVWIDYNQNGTFEKSEFVYGSSSSRTTHNFQITIPSSAACGVTRMRVASTYPYNNALSASNKCGVPDYAEMEDYDLNIQPSTPADDIAVAKVLSPKNNDAPYTIENLEVKLTNASKSTIKSGSVIPISYRTNIMKQGDYRTMNYTLQKDLPSCGSVTPDLGQVNFACQGNKELKMWTSYSPDPNQSNDTLTNVYIGDYKKVLGEDGFESGSFGKKWDQKRGRTNVTSSESYDGNYSMALEDGQPVQAGWDLDFKNANGEIFLEYWIRAEQYFYFGYNDQGIKVSFKGGTPTTQIVDFSAANTQEQQWVKHRFHLNELLANQGLPSVSQIDQIIFSSYEYGDALWFDNMKIVNHPNAKRSKTRPRNLGLTVRDTAYVQSYTNMFSAYNPDGAGFIWKLNGNTFSINENPTDYSFKQSQLGKNTVELITGGCFGLDTSSKVVEVIKPTNPPIPKFIADKQIIDTGEVVDFTNVSLEGPQSWSWNITPTTVDGDDAFKYLNPNGSGGYNPTVEFNKPGVYEVCLTVNNSVSAGPVQKCKKAYIRVRDYKDICSQNRTTDTIGFIRDGMGSYKSDVNCSYLIDPCAQEIELDIKELDLMDKQAFVRIYDGRNAQEGEPLWDQKAYSSIGITGDMSNPNFKSTYTAESGAVFIEFYSKPHDPKDNQGFNIEWNANTRSLKSVNAKINGDTAVCKGKTYNYEATSSFESVDYEWYLDKSLNQQPTATGKTFSVTYDQRKNYTLQLLAKHPKCNRDDTVSYSLFPGISTQKPKVDFNADRQMVSVGEIVKLSDMTQGCIAGHEWSFNPNSSIEYVNGTDEHSKNPYVRFTGQGVYNVTLEDSTNGGAIGQRTKMNYITVQEYCEPTVANKIPDIGIGRVKLESIDNSSLIGNTGYSDYTLSANTAELSKGGSYDITIMRNSALNKANYKVWVDLNRNGEFNEPGETLVKATDVSSTMLEATMEIPKSAKLGTYRMRIGSNLGKLNNKPCGPNRYGEYEDYLIKVVEDTEAPEIVLHRGDTVSLEPCGSPHAVIREAYAEDHVDGKIADLQVSGGVDSSISGMQTVTYTVSDSKGNTATRTQVFDVMPDKEAPHFMLEGDKEYTLGVNNPFNDPGVKGLMDNCSGIQGSVKVDDSKLNNSELGTYPVTYTALDNAGNTMEKTRHVEVVDTVAPSFTVVGKQEMTVNVWTDFEDPGITSVSDNYWQVGEMMVNTTGFVNTKEPGTYKLTYMVEDGSGNMKKAVRTVHVQDISGPEITSKVGDTIMLDVNNELNFRNKLVVQDNVGESELKAKSGSFYTTFPDGMADKLGMYDLNLVYRDENGNESEIELYVNVVDRKSPELTLNGSGFTTIERWDTSEYATAESVKVEDNYYPSHKIDVTMKGSYFSEYLASGRIEGAFDIIYVAEDPSGNKAEKGRTVRVTPSTTGIEDAEGSTLVTVYPNPTEGILNLELNTTSGKQGSVTITDALGETVKVVDQGKLNSGSYRIDMGDNAPGVYFIKYQSEDTIETQRFILAK